MTVPQIAELMTDFEIDLKNAGIKDKHLREAGIKPKELKRALKQEKKKEVITDTSVDNLVNSFVVYE